MYGTQAQSSLHQSSSEFENDVKMYGTQASACVRPNGSAFENDVKMYGTQATPYILGSVINV